MSLRSRIVSLLFVLVLAYGVADLSIQRSEITPIFGRVELDEAHKDLARVHRSIQQRVTGLVKRCRRLAAWDATYAFAGGAPLEQSGLDLGYRPLDRYELDFLYIADTKGQVLWSARRNEDLEQSLNLSHLLSDALLLTGILPRGAEDDEETYVPKGERAGLRNTALGPLIVASEPIVTSSGGGESPGVVLAGRFLTDQVRGEIAAQTQVSFDLWPMESVADEEVTGELIDEVTSSTQPVLQIRDEAILHAYSAVQDMRHAPAFLLRANVERRISQTGATALSYSLNSTVAAALMLLLALVYLLQKTVLRPISVLTDHAVRIGQTEDLFTRLDLDREDEIGILSREFDNMTARLARSREDLVTAARAAGMSEIATGILHNVGNALNSVNISASLVGSSLRDLKAIDDLAEVVRVLEDQGDELSGFIDSAQGQHMRPFLREIADTIQEHRKSIEVETTSLGVGIDHIRELIQSQQSYAGRSALVEPVRAEALLEEAFVISDRALASDAGLTVTREFASIPRCMIDRHKVLEILVNLIQNARQAMVEAMGNERVLTLGTQLSTDMVQISVTDNGIGFDEETSERMFTMGFTTKSDGHGFGLHASANAATELGGTLTATSPGPGAGATFTLSIPFEPSQSLESRS